MVSVEKLLNDDRFYIDDWNAHRIFKAPIKKYEFTEIRLDQIFRLIGGKVVPLFETPVYKFLESDGKNTKIYEEYCQQYCKGNDLRSADVFLELENDMIENDYDPRKGAIFIDQLNLILEGQHRCCILLKKYGGTHSVKVVKVYGYKPKIRTFIKKLICRIKYRV